MAQRQAYGASAVLLAPWTLHWPWSDRPHSLGALSTLATRRPENLRDAPTRLDAPHVSLARRQNSPRQLRRHRDESALLGLILTPGSEYPSTPVDEESKPDLFNNVPMHSLDKKSEVEDGQTVFTTGRPVGHAEPTPMVRISRAQAL